MNTNWFWMRLSKHSIGIVVCIKMNSTLTEEYGIIYSLTKRLESANFKASVGTTENSDDNTLAETVNVMAYTKRRSLNILNLKAY